MRAAIVCNLLHFSIVYATLATTTTKVSIEALRWVLERGEDRDGKVYVLADLIFGALRTESCHIESLATILD